MSFSQAITIMILSIKRIIKKKGGVTLRNTWLWTGISTIVLLSGCAQMNESTSLYEKSGTTINVRSRNDLYNEHGVKNGMDSRLTNFGYVRHQKKSYSRGHDTICDHSSIKP